MTMPNRSNTWAAADSNGNRKSHVAPYRNRLVRRVAAEMA
jgi:hypothetical protein